MNDRLFQGMFDEGADFRHLHEEHDINRVVCGTYVKAVAHLPYDEDDERSCEHTPEDMMWLRWGDSPDFGVWEWG